MTNRTIMSIIFDMAKASQAELMRGQTNDGDRKRERKLLETIERMEISVMGDRSISIQEAFQNVPSLTISQIRKRASLENTEDSRAKGVG